MTEKKDDYDRMEKIDGKGRTFELVANTERSNVTIGSVKFEDLKEGDVFRFRDNHVLSRGVEGCFLNVVLKAPTMVDDLPTLNSQPLNLKYINDLIDGKFTTKQFEKLRNALGEWYDSLLNVGPNFDGLAKIIKGIVERSISVDKTLIEYREENERLKNELNSLLNDL